MRTTSNATRVETVSGMRISNKKLSDNEKKYIVRSTSVNQIMQMKKRLGGKDLLIAALGHVTYILRDDLADPELLFRVNSRANSTAVFKPLAIRQTNRPYLHFNDH